jgi:hypothetical protein
VREARVWAGLLGLERAVVEDVFLVDEGEVVVAVRPGWRERDRCGVCRRSPGFDLGDGRRRWRALELGTTLAFVEAAAPRGDLSPSRCGGLRGAVGTAGLSVHQSV